MKSIFWPTPEPSIKEGCFLNPSILGQGSCVPIVRYPPVMLQAPTISGEIKIPTLITCFPGVWDGSPNPLMSYQWLLDDVAIPGETTLTYTTVSSDDGSELSCLVTATSPTGVLAVESNVLLPEEVLPINVWEYEAYAVSGIAVINHLSMMSAETLVISGMVRPAEQFTNTFDAYVISDMPV